MSKKIVIVGLGLIGGSMAKALALNTDHLVLGMDQREESLLDALSCGAIAKKADAEDLAGADMVYLCVCNILNLVPTVRADISFMEKLPFYAV